MKIVIEIDGKEVKPTKKQEEEILAILTPKYFHIGAHGIIQEGRPPYYGNDTTFQWIPQQEFK